MDETARTERSFSEPVTVHGFMYKRWVYNAQLDRQVCPLLVTRQFEWKPKVVDKSNSLPSTPIMIVIICVVVMIALIVAKAAFKIADRNAKAIVPHQLSSNREQEEVILEFPESFEE